MNLGRLPQLLQLAQLGARAWRAPLALALVLIAVQLLGAPAWETLPYDRAAILARFADRIAHQDGEEIAIKADEAFIESFLDQFGNRVRALSTKTPSLETAFLSLTGRELRDRNADAREVTLAFGKRGGEHTR